MKEDSTMKMKNEWINRGGTMMSASPVLPGVWRRQAGGFVVRGRAKDPRTGKLVNVGPKVLPDLETPKAALVWLEQEQEKIRTGGAPEKKEIPTFKKFSASLFEEQVETGAIVSAKGREKWSVVLRHHLWTAFGDFYVNKLSTHDVDTWRTRILKEMVSGAKVVRVYKKKNGTTVSKERIVRWSPLTANDWLAILRVVTARIAKTYGVPDACIGVEDFPTKGHRTYTDEEPNSLTMDELGKFLSKMLEMNPQHYAMVFTGFMLGHRPSMLRPLRRSGATPDVRFNSDGTGVLLVRQSHTVGSEVMDQTKTKQDQRIALPASVVNVLRWHVETQLRDEPLASSPLLFPALRRQRGKETVGFRSHSSLDKPFAEVATACGLKKKITPKAMRRTYQDTMRGAQVHDVVTRAISGHATPKMQAHYSTASDVEMMTAIDAVAKHAPVVDLDAFRASKKVSGKDGGKDRRSTKRPKVTKAAGI
jgi:hypothetical protein